MALLHAFVLLYTVVVLAAVVFAWLPSGNDGPLVQVLEALTEPLFAFVRRMLPPLSGVDLAPVLVLLMLQLLERMLS